MWWGGASGAEHAAHARPACPTYTWKYRESRVTQKAPDSCRWTVGGVAGEPGGTGSGWSGRGQWGYRRGAGESKGKRVNVGLLSIMLSA